MICMHRPDIALALKDLCLKQAQRAMDEERVHDPEEHLPDELFLIEMEAQGIDPSELPLVREAYEETIAILASADWDREIALEKLEEKVNRHVN